MQDKLKLGFLPQGTMVSSPDLSLDNHSYQQIYLHMRNICFHVKLLYVQYSILQYFAIFFYSAL